MTEFDLAQIPADEGIRFLLTGFLADPASPLAAIGKYVMVPAAVLALALWAVVLLVTRHPGAALPSQSLGGEVAYDRIERLCNEEPSLAVDILAGRVPVDQTVVIDRSAR